MLQKAEEWSEALEQEPLASAAYAKSLKPIIDSYLLTQRRVPIFVRIVILISGRIPDYFLEGND